MVSNEDVIHKDISVDINEEEIPEGKKGFSEAVKAIGNAIFRDYEDKTAYLSSDNILGTIQADIFNDFSEAAFGIRFSSLDMIVALVKSRRQSKDGYGKDKFIEAISKLQTSFELIEGEGLRDKLLRNKRI